jgi:hypothetical protein
MTVPTPPTRTRTMPSALELLIFGLYPLSVWP